MDPLKNSRRRIHTQRRRHDGAWETVPPVRNHDPPGWASVFLEGQPTVVNYGWIAGIPLLQRAGSGEVIANLTEGAVQLPGPSGAWRWRVV